MQVVVRNRQADRYPEEGVPLGGGCRQVSKYGWENPQTVVSPGHRRGKNVCARTIYRLLSSFARSLVVEEATTHRIFPYVRISRPL